MTLHKITELYTECFCLKITLKLRTVVTPNKIMTKIKFVDMSMIFYRTKVNLSKCNGLQIDFIKQNINFKFQLPSTFILFVIHKKVPVKVFGPLMIVRIQTLMVPRFIGQNLQV
jgi:hypothetical protein